MPVEIFASKLFQWYVDQIARVLGRFEIQGSLFGVSFHLKEEAKRSADERIALIDVARANLAQGIRAIDELRAEAEENKKEIEAAAVQLARLENDKASLEHQRDEVKRLVSADIATFQQLAGVPSPAAVRRERFIGFLSGVLASVIASGVAWAIAKTVRRFL